MDGARALLILNQFVADELPPSSTPLQKCQLSELVNEALKSLPSEETEYKSLIDRVEIKKNEVLNPLEILDEVSQSQDLGPLDPAILKVLFDYILSGKTLLNKTHVKLLASLFRSDYYQSPSFPKEIFLQKVFFSLHIPHAGAPAESLENFLEAIGRNNDFLDFVQSLPPSEQNEFLNLHPSLQTKFSTLPIYCLGKSWDYFLSLSTFSRHHKNEAFSLFYYCLIRIPEDKQLSFINSLLKKPPNELNYLELTLSISDIYRNKDIPVAHAICLADLLLYAKERGINTELTQALITTGIERPDFINQDLLRLLVDLDQTVFSIFLKHLSIFLEIDDPLRIMPEIVSLKPIELYEQMYQILIRELCKKESFHPISSILEAKFREVDFLDDTKLEFLSTCLQVTETQKSALIEVSSYDFFKSFSLIELQYFLSKLTQTLSQDRLKDIFKIGYSIARSPEEFIEITTALCQNPPKIEEPFLTSLFDFMLSPHPGILFSPTTFPIFFQVMNHLSEARTSSEIYLMLINMFCSYGIDASDASFESIWFLAHYCSPFPDLLLFIQSQPTEEQKRILQLPTSIWQDVIKYPRSAYQDIITCYELLKSKPSQLWEKFNQNVSKLPEKKKKLLPRLLIPFLNDLDVYEIEEIIDFTSGYEYSSKTLETVFAQFWQLQTPDMPLNGIISFLYGINSRNRPLHEEDVAALLSIDPVLRIACVRHLILLAFLPNLSIFIEFLRSESVENIDEKIFQAFLKTIETTPQLAPILTAFLNREESEKPEIPPKLEILLQLTEMYFSDPEIFLIFTKQPSFKGLRIYNLSVLHLRIQEIPSKKREKFLTDAFKLTDNVDDIGLLALRYPALELTDELIEKLKNHKEAGTLITAILFLPFVPKSLQSHYCNLPFTLEHLFSVDLEVLQTEFFPHFQTILTSPNQHLIEILANFLFEHFIPARPGLIPETSPLNTLIVTMHVLSVMPSTHIENPFSIFSRLTKERRKMVTVSLPYRAVAEKPVLIDLDQIAKTADKAMIVRTYSDLQAAIRTKPVTIEKIQEFFNRFEERDKDLVDAELAQSGFRSLDQLKDSICKDVESSKWVKPGSPDETVPEATWMFNRCFYFYYSQVVPAEGGALLSESERFLLGFINIFIHCPTGRLEQLRTTYSFLQQSLPSAFPETSGATNFLQDYLNQVYRQELANFLTENTELFAKLHHGEPSNVHESEYLINLLGRRLGLLNGEIIFDPNTGSIHPEILMRSTDELFEFVLENFTPEVLVEKIQARITLDLGQDNPMSNMLGTSFERFLTGPEIGWYFNMIVYAEDPDPSKELVSKLFVRDLLLNHGLLQERDPSLHTPSKVHLSIGVDDSGKLLKGPFEKE